ncbi:MAG: hypothetical protein GTO63_19695 [Anaerolineae bacterium]|nr:hypothetical protein [Anaerolineae bacterium]NIN96994.1 hypothetical protein [Anaerolineae bacterium]
MYGLPRQKRAVVLVAVGTLLIALSSAGAVALSGENELPLSFFSTEGEEVGFYTHEDTMPIDELMSDPRAFVAVVEPVERGPIYAVAPEEWSAFGVSDDVHYEGDWPFTPVTVEVAEALKGEIPSTIVVWEERGAVAGFAVDSSDPYLRLGEKGLLIFAKYEDRWFPIVFAPIDDVGRIPSLHTTLEELHQLYK